MSCRLSPAADPRGSIGSVPGRRGFADGRSPGPGRERGFTGSGRRPGCPGDHPLAFGQRPRVRCGRGSVRGSAKSFATVVRGSRACGPGHGNLRRVSRIADTDQPGPFPREWRRAGVGVRHADGQGLFRAAAPSARTSRSAVVRASWPCGPAPVCTAGAQRHQSSSGVTGTVRLCRVVRKIVSMRLATSSVTSLPSR